MQGTERIRSERGDKLPVRQYDRESTDLIISMLGHSEQLSHVLRREGASSDGGHSEPVVVFDALVRDRCRGGDKCRSVDIVVGVKGRKARLIECKLREASRNTSVSKIEGKVSSTVSIIHERASDIVVDKQTDVIYSDRDAGPALRKFHRRYPTCGASDLPLRAMKVSELIHTLFV
ncbi:hypothetical protein [Porphyromonas bennonis]|uniref:hypothetical protein n=1 Tax=Porphyromonas bennonis TaxID=501496 RepID=UPI000361F18D|nr:hypothetical protein [Porphyromonas bennonis]